MQPFRLTDLPIVMAQRRAARINHAVPLQRCDRPEAPLREWAPLVSASLPLSRRRAWIARDGLSLLGLVSVQPRSGQAAWEIDTLIAPDEGDAYLLDLFDRAVATAGAAGAGRLFLRLAEGSPVLDAARRHGFVVVGEETLYGRGEQTALAIAAPAAGRRDHREDQALFQLYSRVIPQEVRWHTALSLAEWHAAEEPLGKRGREWVVRGDDEAPVALVRIAEGDRGKRVAILTDAHRASARAALAVALKAASPHQGFFLLIPSYAVSDTRAAEEAGLVTLDRFALLVRPIAQRAGRLQVAERAVDASATPVTR